MEDRYHSKKWNAFQSRKLADRRQTNPETCKCIVRKRSAPVQDLVLFRLLSF
jgi:hypothetical protein